jgi:outer membrane lipoprotein-sorting protein
LKVHGVILRNESDSKDSIWIFKELKNAIRWQRYLQRKLQSEHLDTELRSFVMDPVSVFDDDQDEFNRKMEKLEGQLGGNSP